MAAPNRMQDLEFEEGTPVINKILAMMVGVFIKRWIVFAIVFAGTAGGGIYFTSTRLPTWQSQATIMLEASDQGSMMGLLPFNPASVTVQPQHLYLSILHSVIYEKRLAEALVSQGFQPREGETMIDLIDRQIDFSIQKNNTFVDISSAASSAEGAFELVDQAVAAFTHRSREIQKTELNTTLTFLDEQLTVVSDQIERVERDIQEFQKANEVDPSDMDRGVWGKLYDLERERSETEIAISMEQMNYNSYGKRFQNLVNETTRELGGKDSPQIQTLKSRIDVLQNELADLVEQNPQNSRIATLQADIERQSRGLVDAISAIQFDKPSLRQQRSALLETLIKNRTVSELTLVSLRNQLRFLVRSIRQFKASHPDILESALKYARLTRSKEVFKNTFKIMLEKREEIRIQAASETGGIKIIDPPYLPEYPEESHAKTYILVSLLLGIILGSGLSYMLEMLDDSIKSADDVRRALNLNVLGYLPRITDSPEYWENRVKSHGFKPEDHGGTSTLLLNSFSPRDSVVEAYRNLKTNITFANSDEGFKSLVISGPGIGEGKSLTAANLAISFAMSGSRTLLIDCDMHKPVQHNNFCIERTPGMADYLKQEVERDEILHPTVIKNLMLIPAGNSPENPTDLISSHQIKELLSWTREGFDVVLIDTPPVNLAVDARLIAKHTQGMVLVLKMEATKMGVAQLCVSQIRKANIEVLGVVLNNFKVSNLYARYYHGEQYSSYHHKYDEN